MSEQGDAELFNGPKPSEKREMSDEQFREQMAQAQAALAQLKKEEGQAKAYDNSLASIIVQFLSKPENTDLFLLVSRTVAQNIPSELIIAILSLVDKRSHDETKGYLESGKNEEMALAIQQSVGFDSLSPAHKKVIDKWADNISKVAMKKPHRAIETIVIPGPERELSSVVVQLSAFILRNYLIKHEISIEFQILRDFMEGVFLEIVKNLEELIKGQKQLT
jgi:hypothetical protein